ncbi:unnamed protein product [Calypogeia fissa]
METSDDLIQAGFSLKERKQEFVSNLSGSTMLEIAALSALVPIFVLLRQVYDLLLSASKANYGSRPIGQNDKGRDGKEYVMALGKDFIFVGVPTIACLTVLADWVYIVTVVSLCLLLVGIAVLWRLNSQGGMEPTSQQLVGANFSTSRKTFLSSFRFTMMLVTCVTILAVDFNVFPRRYAKTETYGTGLMDVGVGSFVVANGLVSRQARELPPSKNGGVLRNTCPLLVLGFSRLLLTKGVDYQEHVAEYGVHWNFFFTLAAVALLTSLVHIPASYCGALGVILLGVYQTILSSGLNEYLLSSERRPNLISLNKEGIFSILGYWSIYLISVQLGHYLIFPPERILRQNDDTSTKARRKGRRTGTVSSSLTIYVWVLDAFLWILAIFGEVYIERISRRMCNLPYVIFVFAMNLEVIAIFLTADVFLPSKQMLLLQIFDNNLLPTFLWGNVLTGLVNVTVDTISASSVTAVLILLGYLATLVGGMAAVELFGLRLKFW